MKEACVDTKIIKRWVGPAWHPADTTVRPSFPHTHPTKGEHLARPSSFPARAGYWAAMSRENVELMHRLVDAFNQGGLDAALPFFDDDIVWHEDPSFPEAGVFRGKEAWTAYARQFLGAFGRVQYDLREVIHEDDRVVVNIGMRGEGTSSGAGFDLSAWWAYIVRDGRITECFSYLERERALEAVGLRR